VKSGASPLHGSILNAWSTNDRVTAFLVEQLPAALWDAAVPGSRPSALCTVVGIES
jgi:hypothetical protein